MERARCWRNAGAVLAQRGRGAGPTRAQRVRRAGTERARCWRNAGAEAGKAPGSGRVRSVNGPSGPLKPRERKESTVGARSDAGASQGGAGLSAQALRMIGWAEERSWFKTIELCTTGTRFQTEPARCKGWEKDWAVEYGWPPTGGPVRSDGKEYSSFPSLSSLRGSFHYGKNDTDPVKQLSCTNRSNFTLDLGEGGAACGARGAPRRRLLGGGGEAAEAAPRMCCTAGRAVPP